MAAAAKPDRNRAVDAYRAMAMVAVAIGHWVAVAVAVDANGDLQAGNALADDPSLAWMTWVFQVMPLFFVVGGFASAMSLDAHIKRGSGRPADWIATRLRRMVAPTALLAATWLGVLTLGVITGTAGTIAVGAAGAAIPLWFLANYTIDTAAAPYLLPRFREHPVVVVSMLGTVFGLVEFLRFADVPVVGHVNWVIGWLMFQVVGFAWRDGLMPRGRSMAAVAGAMWCAAFAAVALGPWPTSMVHFPGLHDSPTHPPSFALMLFGLAYSTTAIAAAPLVDRRLARSARAWTVVVAGNAVSMSIYLWHMTAIVGAGLVFWRLGWLPTAPVGTAAWWIQKVPLVILAAVFLAAVIAVVAPTERRSLLARPAGWAGGPVSMLAVAAVVSTSLKMWSTSSASTLAIGMAGLLIVWVAGLRVPTPVTDLVEVER